MDILNILLLVVCTALLVFQFLTFARLQSLRKALKPLIKRSNDPSQDDDWKWGIERLRSEVQRLHVQVVKMDERLADANDLALHKKAPEPREGAEVVSNGSQDDSNKALYFASANRDAFVDESSLQSEEASDTLYWMEVVSDNEARVRTFGNQQAWKNALQSPELYIVPVCTYRGSPTSATRIRMVNEGAARREKGKWKIVRKIEIQIS